MYLQVEGIKARYIFSSFFSHCYFCTMKLEHFLTAFVHIMIDFLYRYSLFPLANGEGKSAGYPVVLVPGDGGSHVEACLNKTSVVHYLCAKSTVDYFNIWLNLELMVPYVLDCWVDNVRLMYDNQSRLTSNSPGVETRIPGFGNTSSVEWLDPSKTSYGAYYKDIVEALVAVGYERGISVRGAPFDFRKAPNELGDYFASLANLVEDTYENNGNKPVVLVAHSLGGRVMLYFLNQQSQEWKDTYIKSLVTLAAVWGGAVKAMKVYASGDNLSIYVLNAWTLRTAQITNPSLAFLLPSNLFWSSDDVLVTTADRNYTVLDFQSYFQDINYADGYNMWLDTKDLTADLQPPEVEVHCLYGFNIDTEERIVYRSIPSDDPTILYGNGDGTVNLRSLEGCLSWQGQQAKEVHSKKFESVDHMAIVSNSSVIDYLKSVLFT